ncbi:HEPN domain-containing protein [Streptococcus sp. S784/96/1]|uniref:ApeA N-terminal domain 1-containing protein n=1 Tax=Streptococcus sp. S784/96/1 TaxID=2653499 RepID=UPI001386E683|nr:HEPN domain-containing protein [Streptococcus sp. S784/96/1]
MSGLEIYSGKFEYEDTKEEYQGELQIDKINNVITLTLTISSPNLNIIPRFPLESEIKVIYGKLLSGKSIMLYDCYVIDRSNHKNFTKSGLNYTKQVIKANYLFETDVRLGTEGLLITSAQVDFGNILEWANLCHYTWRGDGTSRNPIWIENDPVSINVRDGLGVTFIPSRNTGILDDYQEKIELSQKVYTEFQYEQPVKWENFLEDIKKVEHLIGFGLQRSVRFEGIKCQLLEDDSEDKFWIDEVILGIGRIGNINNQHPYFFLYNLETITEEAHFSKWIEYYEKLKPILDLYFLILDNRYYLTSELVFLNMVQALETFHARFITDDVKNYITRSKSLVERYCDYEGWLAFLCDDRQQKNRSIYLKSRLADLMFADGQHLEMEPQYIQKIVDTRNYYTHYNPKKLERSFTKSELPIVNYKLKLLLEFHIQKLIGFDEVNLKEKYLESIRRLR